jgi:RNA polymerase sigma factor (sigma-70 family)
MNHLHCHRFVRDEDYLPEIRAGGSRADIAISCLYLKFKKRTYLYMERLIAQNAVFKGVPEDLVHDAFIIMIDKIQQEPISVRSLAGFWCGIGKKLFLNQLKKDQRIILVSDVDEKYTLEEVSSDWILMDEEDNDRMEIVFSKLGSRCRQILLLWINQFSMAEIAARMNLSNEAMARKIKYECFKKLKELAKSGNT